MTLHRCNATSSCCARTASGWCMQPQGLKWHTLRRIAIRRGARLRLRRPCYSSFERCWRTLAPNRVEQRLEDQAQKRPTASEGLDRRFLSPSHACAIGAHRCPNRASRRVRSSPWCVEFTHECNGLPHVCACFTPCCVKVAHYCASFTPCCAGSAHHCAKLAHYCSSQTPDGARLPRQRVCAAQGGAGRTHECASLPRWSDRLTREDPVQGLPALRLCADTDGYF